MDKKYQSIKDFIKNNKILSTENICDMYINQHNIHYNITNNKQKKEELNVITESKNYKIIENIKSILNCGICKEICVDVIEVNCCHNIFCTECILTWFIMHFNCPLCRKNLLTTNLQKNKFIKNIINELNA